MPRGQKRARYRPPSTSRVPDSIKPAILNGFRDVDAGEHLRAGEIGDGARDLERAVVGARGELGVAGRRTAQQIGPDRVEL